VSLPADAMLVINDDWQGKSVMDKRAVQVVVWVSLPADLLPVFNDDSQETHL